MVFLHIGTGFGFASHGVPVRFRCDLKFSYKDFKSSFDNAEFLSFGSFSFFACKTKKENERKKKKTNYASLYRCCTAAAPCKDRVTVITFGSDVPFVKQDSG